MAADVVKLKKAKTVQGAEVKIAVKGRHGHDRQGKGLEGADIACKNGVIHVIDSVIMPRGHCCHCGRRGEIQNLGGRTKAAGLDKTLKEEGPFTVFAPTDEAFEKLPAGTVEDLLEAGE